MPDEPERRSSPFADRTGEHTRGLPCNVRGLPGRAHPRSAPRRRPRRSGAAIVEFAVCLPVILSLFLGAVESCNMIFLRHTLTVAAYEGLRHAIQYDSTTDAARARCEEVLVARNVSSPTITFTPTDVDSVAAGSHVAIDVSVSCDANSVLPLSLFVGRTMHVTTTMVKE